MTRKGGLVDGAIQEGEVTEVEDGELAQGEKCSENGFSDAAESIFAVIEKKRPSKPRTTWLYEELIRYRIHPALIQQCEDLLIVREGFTTAEVFASIPAAKVTHEYLTEIGVNQLGVQGVLLTVHKNLREEISLAEVANIPSPAVKWLRSKFHAAHTLPHLQRECEWKLVVQEGITSKDLFASLPENVFNVSYLKRIGIVGLGLQHVLLEYHTELHYAYIQQLNFMARAHHLVPQKVGHKRGAERNGNSGNHDGSVSEGGAEDSSHSTKKQHTNKKAQYEEVELVADID
eukprot:gene27434-31008_t